MKPSLPLKLNLRLWFGVLAAPLAWTAQHLTGFALTQADCNSVDARLPLDGVTLAVTVAAALVAAAGGLVGLKLFRETRDAAGLGGDEEDPPLGRVHFLATVSIVVAPLLFSIIVMSGLGAVFLADCHQG